MSKRKPKAWQSDSKEQQYVQEGMVQPQASFSRPTSVSENLPPDSLVPKDLTTTLVEIFVQASIHQAQEGKKLNRKASIQALKDVNTPTTLTPLAINYEQNASYIIKKIVGAKNAQKFGFFEAEWIVDEAEDSDSLGLDFAVFDSSRRPSQEKKSKTLLLRRRIIRQLHPQEYPLITTLGWMFLIATGPIKRRKSSLSSDTNVKLRADGANNSTINLKMPPINTSDGRSLHFMIKSLDDESSSLDQLRLQQFKRMSIDRLEGKLKLLDTEEKRSIKEVSTRYNLLREWLTSLITR